MKRSQPRFKSSAKPPADGRKRIPPLLSHSPLLNLVEDNLCCVLANLGATALGRLGRVSSFFRRAGSNGGGGALIERTVRERAPLLTRPSWAELLRRKEQAEEHYVDPQYLGGTAKEVAEYMGNA